MKKIISVLILLCSITILKAQESKTITLLDPIHYYNSYSFPNRYVGKDKEHTYYSSIKNGIHEAYMYADHKGNCSELEKLTFEFNDEVTYSKTMVVDYVFFNRRAYVFYKAFSYKTNNWKLFYVQFPKDGKIHHENSKLLSESSPTKGLNDNVPLIFQPLILLNHDSTEIAVISNNMKVAININNDIYLAASHVTIYNLNFEILKEADLSFENLNTKFPVMTSAIYDDDKIIYLMDSKIIEKNSLDHLDVMIYDFITLKTKSIKISGEKRIVIDKYSEMTNFKYKKGFLYLFGQAVSKAHAVGVQTTLLEELAFITIDINAGTSLIKYLPIGIVKKNFPNNYFFVLDISFCDDNSVIVYNDYTIDNYRNDTIDCIKFNEKSEIVWRKKIGIRTGYPNFDNVGYYFQNDKRILLYVTEDAEYTKGAKGSLSDLIRIDFNDDGSYSEKIIYQFKESERKISFFSLGLMNDNNLSVEFKKGHDAQFLKIPL